MESQGKGVKDDSRAPSLSDWYDGGSGDRHGRVRRSHVWEKKGNSLCLSYQVPNLLKKGLLCGEKTWGYRHWRHFCRVCARRRCSVRL